MLIIFTYALFAVCAASDVPEYPERRVIGLMRSSGRLIETFNEKFLEQLDESTATRLKAQIELDIREEMFTPKRTEPFTEFTPRGKITLGKVLYRGAYSTLFVPDEFPDLVIKYQVQCSRLNEEIHPLLRDAWYANDAAAHGISPTIHFVSPPAAPCLSQTGKCAFTIGQYDWEYCHRRRGALRYMILDRSKGLSLHSYRINRLGAYGGAMSVADAMMIGYTLIGILKKLHLEVGIVHGDIHSPNILIERSSNSTNATAYNLKLIDFGYAFPYPKLPLPDVPVTPAQYWYHELFTQWQIDGYAWSARDDVLKAIQVVAHLMHPFEYFEMEKKMRDAGVGALEDWKCHKNWFVTERRDPVQILNIQDSQKMRIYALMENILNMGRNMTINGPLPYDDLRIAMLECSQIASNNTVIHTTTTQVPPNSSLAEAEED